MIHTLAGAAQETQNESTAPPLLGSGSWTQQRRQLYPVHIMQATVVMPGHDNVIIVYAFTCRTLWFVNHIWKTVHYAIFL